MKIILAAINAKYIHSNLAIYTLTAGTPYPVKKKEYTINQLEQEILMDLYREKPDVLAFSVYIWNVSMVLSLSKEIKKLLPDCSIIVGGPEVSYEMETFLKENPQIDLILYSEGERAFCKVVEAYVKEDLKEVIKNQNEEMKNRREVIKNIESIAYREGSKVIVNPVSSLMDMNQIPFVYEKMEDFKHKIIYYESSRGCPFSCSYCLSSIDKKVRFRDVEVVKRELQFFLDQKVPQVKFVDRTFNCNHKHAMEIWEYIQSHDNGITNFHFEIAADLLTKEELEILKKMRPGLVQLEIGVQSTNEKTIEEINRKMDLEKVKENVKTVRSYENIHQHLDLIAGLPFEDYETFKTSFHEVYRMEPDQLQLGFLKVLKGSKMFENREEYGLIYQDKAPYEVFCTNWISYDEIIRLKQVEGYAQMVTHEFNACPDGSFRQLNFPDICLRQRNTCTRDPVFFPFQITGFIHNTFIKHAGNQIQKSGTTDADRLCIPYHMEVQFLIIQPYTINGARTAPHSAGYLCTFKCGARSGRAGDSTVPIAKNHLAVGSDIDHQRQVCYMTKIYGNHTAHCIRTYKPCNIR